jgi:type IX secretion system PorP/SprF family membrane protein
MKRIYFSAIIILATVFGAKAQQDPEYSMYMFNGLFLNPAYAGSHDVISMVGIYRHQWAGLEGAPRTANISVHTPFRRDQYAMGGTISNDRLGLTNVFQVTPAFSYRLRFNKNENMRLCFGVQASFSYFYQNNRGANLATQTSDIAFSINENMFIPNVGAGIYFYTKRFYVGASVPHMVPFSLQKAFKVVKPTEQQARLYYHYLFTAGGVIGKDASIVKFKPSMLMKYQKGLYKNIPQFDISAALLFIDRLWVGATYRTGGDQEYIGQSVIAMIEFKPTPQLRIGYAYDIEMTALRKYSSGTHEIMLGYDFWYDKRRFVTPRYVKYF